MGYFLVKLWISTGLFCYYQKIKVVGVERIPLEKPVLFLSNHQNALLDVFLIATLGKRRLWFITRSDVFQGDLLKGLFQFLQMLPIYRMRDGKENLHKNNAIFEKCSHLLKNNEAILLFPEANHSLKRRVRPLSKGFTRIIAEALQKTPDLDLKLVPVGQNYKYPTQVGDSAAVYFGEPISVQAYWGKPDFVSEIKQEVHTRLKQLTTHIPEAGYEHIIQQISNPSIYLNPAEANEMIVNRDFSNTKNQTIKGDGKFGKTVSYLWNFPMIFLWRTLVKPKIPEVEFQATFRFGFILIMYPVVYLFGMLVLANLYGIKTAYLSIFGHAAFNILLIKMGVTSSDQRK
ncbi:lysophospholipid acyltransferase family protein [Flagellimonas sp.]|uniref:lysophospholipid acyltransferase family protein n=1 Tax=Flagellimonas sp. TaxID=2058762 RepID=UPI003B506BB2